MRERLRALDLPSSGRQATLRIRLAGEEHRFQDGPDMPSAAGMLGHASCRSIVDDRKVCMAKYSLDPNN